MTSVTRYPPVLVILHWTLALLIVATLTYGFVRMGNLKTGDPLLVPALRLHVLGGTVIAGLMSWRFYLRMTRPRPAPERGVLGRIAVVSHYGFYLLVAAVALTGAMTILTAGLAPAIVWGGQGVPPQSFKISPFEALAAFQTHAILVTLLANLVLLHLLAALYHQFIRRDGLFGRMSFRPKP